ncbi:MAG: SpoIIE family protein phosphatase [Bacteroidales bacterium]|nr:SpoIIE family protein phosphatase [Bacteroidales bacterium]
MINSIRKILILLFVFLYSGVYLSAQNTDETRAQLFFKICDELIFIGDASKLDYIVATYGCSNNFIQQLSKAKPGVFNSQRYEIVEYNLASPPPEYDILLIDKSKEADINLIYSKLLTDADNNSRSVAIFTNNWADTNKIVFNIVVEPNSDIVTFEYNTENLNKFNVSTRPNSLVKLNGIDIGARKLLDKTRIELQQAELDLRVKEQELDNTIQELNQQQAKIDAQVKEIHEQQLLIDQIQEDVIRQQSKLQNLEAELYVKRQDLIRQQQKFAQKDIELRQKEQEILDFQAKIDQMQERFLEQTAIIDAKTAELDKKTAEVDQITSEIEDKKRELGNLNNIIKMQRYALIVFGFLMAIIVLLAIWNFRNYRKMQQQNIVLAHQKNEIEAQAEELEKANLELEKLSIVASKTSNAVSILDNSGKFEWINAGFTQLYGYTLQLLKQELDENIEKNELYKGIAETFNKVVTKRESFYFEHESLTRSNKKIWIQTAITPIVNYDGELKQVVLVDSDISIIKEAEQQIAKQNKDIRNSILYASRIQKATLPSTRILLSYLPESFILFLPRDIVSGDFYWSTKIGKKIFFAAADCTGHGVPGAFMSMLGITLLNETISNLTGDQLLPNFVLDELREKLIHALRQSEEGSSNKDGIALALCMVEEGSNTLHYAGAENEIVLVRDGDVYSYKADDMLISLPVKETYPFTNNEIEFIPNDMIYLFSDGYVDQFGGQGPRRKKFMIKRLRDLFGQIYKNTPGEQVDILRQTHLDWKGDNNQLDDIIIMGVKL